MEKLGKEIGIADEEMEMKQIPTISKFNVDHIKICRKFGN